MPNRTALLRVALALGLMALLLPVLAGQRGIDPNRPVGEKVGDSGRIDYDKGMVYATGQGVIPNDEPNSAKAYLRGKGFAKLDALRNLLMVVDHVRIDSETVGSDYEAKSDEIRAEVKGIVRGAQVVSERKIPMGNSFIVEVTVSSPFYGDRGIASAFIPEINRQSRAAEDHPAPASGAVTLPDPPRIQLLPPAARVETEPLTSFDPSRPITGLIIDTRGQRVERCMSPKILRGDGSELWGTVNVNPDWVIANGIVSYSHSISDAKKNNRVGTNPLIVRGIGVGGGRFNSNAVVSDEDATTIAQYNRRDHFLDKYHVIFVVDADK